MFRFTPNRGVPMNNTRHIASIVLTGAEPAETDLILDTLASSKFLELERYGSNYIDVEVIE